MDDIRPATNQAPGSIRVYLRGMRFPGGKDESTEELGRHDAPDRLIDQVEGTATARFASLAGVLVALDRAR